MKSKLYPNLKRMTTIFSVFIIAATLILLGIKITVFSDVTPVAEASQSSDEKTSIITGDDTFPFSLNGKVYFNSFDSRGNFLIENFATSEFNLSVEVYRDDGTKIFTSGTIAPGSSLANGKLEGASLDNGVYECTALLSAKSLEDGSVIREREVPITVYIGVKPS